MSIIINIVLILVSLVLIVAVLMQEGNKQGLGAIGGAAETFLGKNKSKSYEGKLLNITKIGAAVFVVLAVVATWFNAKTFTVTYFVDDVEVFPKVDMEMQMQAIFNNEVDPTLYDELSAEDKRATYFYGDTVIAYPVPEREGYDGEWDKALPETMDRKNYVLNAVYKKGTYTVTFDKGTVPGTEDATASEAEDTVLGVVTGTYEDPIDPSQIPALPVAPEGYEVSWNTELPETIPGYDLTITAVYFDTTVEEEENEDVATPSEIEETASSDEATADPAVTDEAAEEASAEADAAATPAEAE